MFRLTPDEAATLKRLVHRSQFDRHTARDTAILCRWLVDPTIPADEKHALLATFRGGL